MLDSGLLSTVLMIPYRPRDGYRAGVYACFDTPHSLMT